MCCTSCARPSPTRSSTHDNGTETVAQAVLDRRSGNRFPSPRATERPTHLPTPACQTSSRLPGTVGATSPFPSFFPSSPHHALGSWIPINPSNADSRQWVQTPRGPSGGAASPDRVNANLLRPPPAPPPPPPHTRTHTHNQMKAGLPEALLGRPGALLGSLVALLGDSWAVLGRCLGPPQPSWAV